MSDINILDNETSQELSLSSQAVDHIRVMAKWGRFLSIVGFVFIGLMVLTALFMGTFIARAGGLGMSGVGVTFVYLLFAALYLYPTWQLNHFSRKAKSAIALNSGHELADAFQGLRGFFAFFGILTAIILGLYALILVIGLLGGLAAFLG